MNNEAPIGFLGLSHLGVVSSVAWSSLGQQILAIDDDTRTVAALQRGHIPVHEPGLEELFERVRKRITFSSEFRDLAACPLVVQARDVPTNERNQSDLQPIEHLLDRAIPHLRQDVVLVVMSQVPPGFTRRLAARIRDARPNLRFKLFYLAETLIFGDAVKRSLAPERLILGCSAPHESLPSLLATALQRFSCPILPMTYESAELTKLAINLYLVSAVTYSNTLADLCEAIGADWSEMVPALRMDKRIGPAAYLRPSLGVAGGNLERDLVTLHGLTQRAGTDSTYLDTMTVLNQVRLGWVERKIAELGVLGVKRPAIGVWGLTYKGNTRSTKNSPALRVIDKLGDRAKFTVWDPVIRAGDVALNGRFAASQDEVLDGADALLILADWPEFGQTDFEVLRGSMSRALVIDCVGVLEGRRQELHDIEYVSMGR